MNLFFHENTPSAEAGQFLTLLRSKKNIQKIHLLNTERHGIDTHNLTARNGDLLILFATTDAELAALLETHELFSDFQIILILIDHSFPNIITSHALKPRFIGFADSDILNLEQFIVNINKNTTNNPY